MPYVKKVLEEDLQLRKPHKEGRLGTICDMQDEGVQWLQCLSRSEQAKVHLARAFIMNPEVLVLQHPFKHFDDGMDDKMQSLLREHINHRGIGMPTETIGRRRPRTVFFTADGTEQEDYGDVIWKIERDGSVQMRIPQGAAERQAQLAAK